MKLPTPLPASVIEDSLSPAAASAAQPELLCVMRMPPNRNGHGGSQRALHLLEALRQHGRVHFVLFYREQDHDCMTTSLAPIEPLCASVTRVQIAGWQGAKSKKWGVIPGKVQDLVRMGSHEVPRLSNAELASIADRLPIRRPDLLFAGRLCCAWILQALIDRGLLQSPYRIVDYDDIMSKFRARQLQAAGATMGAGRRALMRVDASIIASAERKIANAWHGVSVCTQEDVVSLREMQPSAVIAKLVNVMDRDVLPPRPADGTFRILFTGNLGFSANIDGLQAFIDAGWPSLLQAVPTVKLSIVGLNPSGRVVELAEQHGFELHGNVPSLQPFYEACDVVIAPILFGSGTRIKILEAMAYGRPVVSTSMGAEGMDLEDGVHVLLADSMPDFAQVLIDLAREPERGRRLAASARRFQEQNYAPAAFQAAIARWISDSRVNAERLPA